MRVESRRVIAPRRVDFQRFFFVSYHGFPREIRRSVYTQSERQWKNKNILEIISTKIFALSLFSTSFPESRSKLFAGAFNLSLRTRLGVLDSESETRSAHDTVQDMHGVPLKSRIKKKKKITKYLVASSYSGHKTGNSFRF